MRRNQERKISKFNMNYDSFTEDGSPDLCLGTQNTTREDKTSYHSLLSANHNPSAAIMVQFSVHPVYSSSLFKFR